MKHCRQDHCFTFWALDSTLHVGIIALSKISFIDLSDCGNVNEKCKGKGIHGIIYTSHEGTKLFQSVLMKTCLPAVGPVLGCTVDVAGVVQGLVGLAFGGRTVQPPTVN